MDLSRIALLAGSAAVAGAINAVAGGGTLVSFPALVAVGFSPLVANATNAVALTPGSIASAFGYRREIGADRAVLRLLLPSAAIGGVIGSILLLVTPQRVFDSIVPLLVLFATALLFAQNLRRAPAAPPDGGWNLPRRPWVAALLQLLVGIYGGYFGAGMGIMILALFASIGGADIHRMNGVKSVLGGVINAIAAVTFLLAGAIDFRAAVIMAVGASLGGLVGAAGARRIKPATIHWGVVAIGMALTGALVYRRWLAPTSP